jgi:hypothetical protein
MPIAGWLELTRSVACCNEILLDPESEETVIGKKDIPD